MWITYSVLVCKLATRILTFSIFILSGKNCKSLLSSCNFSVYWTLTLRKYHFLHYSFYKIFNKLRSIFNLLKIVYWKLLQHCQPYTLFTFQYWRYDNFLFLSESFQNVTVISFCISINRVTYSSSNTFFDH